MRSWPLSDLRLTTPLCELRLLTEPEVDELAHAAYDNVLERHQKHFMGDWTQLPDGAFQRSFYQYQMLARAAWTPQKWDLQLGVFPAGHNAPVGCMSVSAANFGLSLTVSTGSWILPAWRGRGLGKQMRTAVLHLAFHELGAAEALSGAHPDNRPSLGVSRALGYRENGINYQVMHGCRSPEVKLRCVYADFTPACAVQVTGLDDITRALFGAARA